MSNYLKAFHSQNLRAIQASTPTTAAGAKGVVKTPVRQTVVKKPTRTVESSYPTLWLPG